MASKIIINTIKRALAIGMFLSYFIFSCGYMAHCTRIYKTVGILSTYNRVFQNEMSKTVSIICSEKGQSPVNWKFLSSPWATLSDKVFALNTVVGIRCVLSFFVSRTKVSFFQNSYALKAQNSTSLIVFFHIWRI